jgi:hypothetical protein
MIESSPLPPEQPKRGRLAPNDPEWCFRIQGHEAWIDSFTNDLNSVDISIFPDYEDDRPTVWFMTSPHLTGLTAAQATARAQQLLVLLNGALRLTHTGWFRGFELGECLERRSLMPTWAGHEETLPMKAFPPDVEDYRYFNPRRPLDYYGAVLFLSRSDPQLSAILRILGTGPVSLMSLSKVLDTVEGSLKQLYPKGKDRRPALAALGKVTPRDLENFDYTANNFEVSDIDARHGMDDKFGLSERLEALTLEKATQIVLSCARAFVLERARETFTPKFRAVLITDRSQAD